MSDLSALPHDFAGVVRLFPLPNTVLFPRVPLPLHIFEPRYRQMTADALSGDRLITMVLLQPGWQTDYDGRPAIHNVACIGQIVGEQQLEDGRYNLMLRGLCRARIDAELVSDKLYRSARVHLLDDRPVQQASIEQRLRKRLDRILPRWFNALGVSSEDLNALLPPELPLGIVCDIAGFALPLPEEVKQELLAELRIEQRTLNLLAQLQATERLAEEQHKFPPDFSSN
jgi:Lon protease-like protein